MLAFLLLMKGVGQFGSRDLKQVLFTWKYKGKEAELATTSEDFTYHTSQTRFISKSV